MRTPSSGKETAGVRVGCAWCCTRKASDAGGVGSATRMARILQRGCGHRASMSRTFQEDGIREGSPGMAPLCCSINRIYDLKSDFASTGARLAAHQECRQQTKMDSLVNIVNDMMSEQAM
jgi:hypothetical protein